MKITALSAGLVIPFLSFLSFSHADSDLSASTNIKNQNTARPKILDYLSVEYATTFAGPSLANPISNMNFDDEAGELAGASELESALLTGVRLNPDLVLGTVTKWNWHSASDVDQAIEMLDPYLILSHTKLYSAGNLNLAADFRLSAPVSEKSKAIGHLSSFASEQGLIYEVPGSRLRFGLTSYIQYTMHGANAHAEADLLGLRLSPGVNYKVSNSVLLNLVYEIEKSQASFAEFAATHPEGSLIETGIVWDISENLRFSPNVHTKTSRPLSAEAFTLGAKINWVLLYTTKEDFLKARSRS